MIPAVEIPTKVAEPVFGGSAVTVDDEDDLLYGDSDITMTSPSKPAESEVTPAAKSTTQTEVELKPTYWALIAWQHGNLEVSASSSNHILILSL